MGQRFKIPRKKGTNADAMLSILESYYPSSVPTGELARRLFGKDGLEARIKVQKTARTLRKWGYLVYGFDGTYKFCTNPEDMARVFERNAKLTVGVLVSTGGAADEIENLGDPGRAAEARFQFKKTLIELIKTL